MGFRALKHVDELVSVGVPDKQAKKFVQLVQSTIESEVAKKEDIKTLELKVEKDIKALELKVEKDIKALELKVEKDIKALELKIEKEVKALELKIEKEVKALDLKIEKEVKALDLKIEEVKGSLKDLELRLTLRLGGIMMAGIVIVTGIMKLM